MTLGLPDNRHACIKFSRVAALIPSTCSFLIAIHPNVVPGSRGQDVDAWEWSLVCLPHEQVLFRLLQP